jgi:hypothetical protein
MGRSALRFLTYGKYRESTDDSLENRGDRIVAVVHLGALSALIAFPAQAGQRNHQNNVSPFCDNDGRCTTFNLAAPVSSKTQSLRGRSLHRAVDVNGNTMMVTVQTAYGFNITVHPAYASKFLKFMPC